MAPFAAAATLPSTVSVWSAGPPSIGTRERGEPARQREELAPVRRDQEPGVEQVVREDDGLQRLVESLADRRAHDGEPPLLDAIDDDAGAVGQPRRPRLVVDRRVRSKQRLRGHGAAGVDVRDAEAEPGVGVDGVL